MHFLTQILGLVATREKNERVEEEEGVERVVSGLSGVILAHLLRSTESS